tara:strand:+ start:794 stop:964 length:171 start_codon:yes stop_codon:yes gene_type:complete
VLYNDVVNILVELILHRGLASSTLLQKLVDPKFLHAELMEPIDPVFHFGHVFHIFG